jgi:hypothetical protein
MAKRFQQRSAIRLSVEATAACCHQQVRLKMSTQQKELKKQFEGPKKQHSRHFREELLEFLDDVKKGIDEGDEWGREFKPHIPDEDTAPGLVEYFERSGWDITAPGHCQDMLFAVWNAYGKNWTRVVTTWPESEKNRFLRNLLDERLDGQSNSRIKLCERLHENNPKEYPAAAVSLRIQLQKILKEKRERVANESATDQDVELLKKFDG